MTTPNTGPPVATGTEEVATSGGGNALNVLVAGTDLNFAKMVQVAFQAVAPDNTDKSFRVFPGVSKEKILELIEKHPLHSILVEEEVINDRTPEQYLSELREMCKKNPANAQIPIVIVCSKTDRERTLTLVRSGWKDVLLKPLDSSLFIQKMNLYNPALPVIKEAVLFSMDCEKEIDLSFRYKSKTLSEYGMKVESNKPLDAGTVLWASAPYLSEPLAAVVMDCKKVSDTQFMVSLMFIGITPAETQSIRKLIRQEYAEEKQAA
ncbi:MAG: hypothetical protein KF802_01305 [Bdellovibrionaceae bacterium]|nr:hypothetical protein [Pseudobdellovibrionaceae bacterium]MBX3034340.1 hypothetical protein [Pseudobdellovibrionaceae bacterium]